MKDHNKIIIEAPLFLRESENHKTEYAARIPLPSENQQVDLMHMSAILVSTGTNKNGATFLGSELVRAKDTIADKALDVEHAPDKIVGHIKSSMFLDLRGSVIDIDNLYKEISAEDDEVRSNAILSADQMEMDVGIVCVVHKHRFKDLAEEIKKGEWFVSMECYYSDFDLKIGDIIIPKEGASEKVFDLKTNEMVKLVISGQSLGNHKISRVLRGIKFCGVGLVKHPANVRSVIDESAGEIKVRDQIGDGLTKVYREAAGEVRVNSEGNLKHLHLPEDDRKEVLLTNPVKDIKFYSVVSSEKISDKGPFYVDTETDEALYTSQYHAASYDTKEEATKIAVRATTKTGVTHFVTEVLNTSSVNNDSIFTEEQMNNGFALLQTTKQGDIVNMVETANFAFLGKPGAGGKWGVEDNAAGLCVDFTKYHYEFDRSPNPGKLMGVHWCKLFDTPCPVIGADALASECLRHRYSRLIKDDIIHFNATRKEKWNPNSLVDNESVEFLPAEDQPKPDDRSGDSEINEKYGERYIQGPPAFDDSFEKPPIMDITAQKSGVDAPRDPDLTVTEVVTKYDPGLDEFKSLLSEAARVVRKAENIILTKDKKENLSDSEFAFPERKSLPIHNADAVTAAMRVIKEKILDEYAKKENGNPLKYLQPHARILHRAVLYKIDTTMIEDLLHYEVAIGDDGFGIPRLKLLPLNSKQAVIAAMSRFDNLRQEITPDEKDILFVKILKAAKKFDINVETFVSRVRNKDKV